MFSNFFGYEADPSQADGLTPRGGPAFRESPNDPNVRYVGSTADAEFAVGPQMVARNGAYTTMGPANNFASAGLNGYATYSMGPTSSVAVTPTVPQPYPFSTYSAPKDTEGRTPEPIGPKKVVSERVITREEMFASGNLVEAPTQKVQAPIETSPLMPEFRPQGPVTMMAPGPGGSVTMSALPAGMPMQMGGSVQLSSAPIQLSAVPSIAQRGPGQMQPAPSVFLQGAPGGSFTAAPPQFPGAQRMGGSITMSVLPQQAPGGSFTAAPMGPMVMQPGQPMGPMVQAPGGSLRMSVGQMPAQAIIAPMGMAPAGGSVRMSAQPMAMPMQMGPGMPIMGGSITMPVAQPQGASIGACGCPSCQKPGTSMCSQCQTKAYCSVECQQKDWSAHKVDCKRIAAERKAAEAKGAPQAAAAPQGPASGQMVQQMVRPIQQQQMVRPQTMPQGAMNRISIPVQQQVAMMPNPQAGLAAMPLGKSFPSPYGAPMGGSFNAAPMAPMMGGSFNAGPPGMYGAMPPGGYAAMPPGGFAVPMPMVQGGGVVAAPMGGSFSAANATVIGQTMPGNPGVVV